MSIEGTFIYSCPSPIADVQQYPSVTITNLPDPVYLQSLLDTIRTQRQEIETLRKMVVFVRSFMTPEQHKALSTHVMELLTEEEKK